MEVFCYVVLHFQNDEMTRKCVDALLEISASSPVVVVDNASPNRSGSALKEHYANNVRVTVLQNDYNEGFARGNNMGYRYAKRHLNPDAIVVMNNDVIIDQKDFEHVLSDFMNKSNVDVCGPDILTPSCSHQNPLLVARRSTIFYCKMLCISIARFILLKINLLGNRVVNGYLAGSRGHVQLQWEPRPYFNCVLHGSCVVFGPEYVKHEEFAFLPDTYLYGEELLLSDYMAYRGYSSGIAAGAQVFHFGGQSTGEDCMKNKIMFKLRNEITAYYQLIKHRLSWHLW